jgi:glutamyl-tRNA reductase
VRSRELARSGDQRTWIDGLEALFGVTPDAAAESLRSERRAADAARDSDSAADAS